MSRLLFFIRPVALLPFLLVGLAGCPGPQPRQLSGSGMDMFAPTAMRVHPLTRTVPAQPAGNLEVHIELTDQFGDVGKGVGNFSFELFDYALTAVGHRGTRLAAWTADITAPVLNRQHWDPITRTYLFKSALDPALLTSERKFVLRVVLNFPNNTSLSDEYILTVR